MEEPSSDRIGELRIEETLSLTRYKARGRLSGSENEKKKEKEKYISIRITKKYIKIK